MKAARWYGQGDLRICEMGEPQPAEGEVKIEVKWCGICGSDMGMYEKGPIMPVEATMETAVELTRRGGRIVAVGFSDNPFPLTVNRLITAKQSIIGTLGYGDEFPQAISILEETEERARELITAKIEIDEIIGKGYNELIKNKDKHIKILVSPLS